MADVDIKFGAQFKILHILKDYVGFHCQYAIQNLFYHFERIVASAQKRSDIGGIDNCIISDIEELGAGVDRKLVDIGDNGLNLMYEGQKSVCRVRPRDKRVAIDDDFKVLID